MNLINKEKYFIHKGTWKNDYQWKIQKVKVTGIKINSEEQEYAEFSFHSCGYEYPVSYLKDTLEEAKEFAIKLINEEKARQIKEINDFKEEDCVK